MFISARKAFERLATRFTSVALAAVLAQGCAATSAAPRLVSTDPLVRQTAIDRVQRQIVHQVADIPAPRYVGVVRPHLERRLLSMGFTAVETAVILADVEASRRTPARPVVTQVAGGVDP